MILLKFLNGDNFEGFYNALDVLLSESISDFNDLDLVDKAYTYIAYYFYSVRTSIAIKSDKIDSLEVPLTILLDSLENNYKKDLLEIPFYNWTAKTHYPKRLSFDEPNLISIDFLSALRYVGGLEIKTEQLDSLNRSTPTKVLNDFQYHVFKNFSFNVDLCKDVPTVENITENVLSPGLYYSIAHIYKDLLENFYNMQYLLTHYVKISWDSILNLTPIETTILYKNFMEDKEKQNEQSKTLNNNNLTNNLTEI